MRTVFVLYWLVIVAGLLCVPRRGAQRMRTFLRENGLSIFFPATFLATLIAQSFAGRHSFNAEQAAHGASAVSWWAYVTSVVFWGAVMENWQSEFLQFTFFIGATIWLVQKGSNDRSGPRTPAARRTRGRAWDATRANVRRVGQRLAA